MRLWWKTAMNRLAVPILVVITLVAPAQSHAGALNPNFSVPSFYGATNTTYQEWYHNFTLTGTSPPAASSNSYGTANFTDPTYPGDGAFVITQQSNGSGDVYSFSGVIQPQIVVPSAGLGSGYTTTIVFQFETYGQENPTLPSTVGQALVSPDLTLTGSNGTSITSASVELEASTSSQFGGFGTAYTNDYIAKWTVAGSASSYTIDYNSDATSTAFTAARVDTLTMLTPQSVPEPASIVMMSLGLIVALGWSGLRHRSLATGGRHRFLGVA
jgi:hypothetical protein